MILPLKAITINKSKYWLYGIIVLAIIGIIFISGYTQQQIRYVCPDGTTVSDVSLCPKQETQEETQVDTYCGDGICQSDENCQVCSRDCGSCRLEITYANCKKSENYKYRVTWLLTNKNSFDISLKAYTRAIFSYIEHPEGWAYLCYPHDISECLEETISLRSYETKEYSYNFSVGQPASKVKLYLVSKGIDASNEFSVDCQ